MHEISLMELSASVCELVDLVSDEIKDHHNKVACGAYHLTNALGIDGVERRDIVVAAAMHDIGGLTVGDRLKAVTMDFEDAGDHAEKGYRLLSGFRPFQRVANIIRYHHTPWDHGNARDADGNPIPIGSQIVLMADRISVMLKPGINMLNDAKRAADVIIAQEGGIYMPEVVSALKKVARKDAFWLDIMSQSYFGYIYDDIKSDDLILHGDDLIEALNLICDIVDYRSSFTAYHSKGVSAVSEALSELLCFSKPDVSDMRIAGLLHDIGKLAVPAEIIEKPGPLDAGERNIIRCHPYYTDKVLAHLSENKIREWASLHHENSDGGGYPFGLGNGSLNLGSKILKAADVFVALMEDRPYRKSMGADNALWVMCDMADNGLLDTDIVSVLSDNLAEVSELLSSCAAQETRSYKKFMAGL